jgi:hypothetical protein
MMNIAGGRFPRSIVAVRFDDEATDHRVAPPIGAGRQRSAPCSLHAKIVDAGLISPYV